VARSILVGTASAWLLAGVAGLGLAAFGVEALERILPPLAIDTDALRAAIVSFAIGLVLVGAVHVAILLGLRARRRLAWTAGILMSGVLAATCVALAAAAATSAVADPSRMAQYLAGALGAGVGGLAYGVVAAHLVGELRRRSVI
jgi:hypothetical protein